MFYLLFICKPTTKRGISQNKTKQLQKNDFHGTVMAPDVNTMLL